MKYIFISFLLLTLNSFSKNTSFVKDIVNCTKDIQADYEVENRIPNDLILAQAILESNWGKSRFAREGNNYFGMRTWDLNDEHILPLNSTDNSFGLKVYDNICSSVSDYLHNLNTSPSYKQLRKIRKIENILWSRVDALELANGLISYSEEASIYVAKVKNQIRSIRSNMLLD